VRQSARWAGVVVAGALVVGGGLWSVWPGDGGAVRPPAAAAGTPSAAAAATAAATAEPTTSLTARPACLPAGRSFDPRAITVPGVTRAAAVVAPPRDANGVPGTPPLSTYGKSVFAWDREQGIRPGDPEGNVLLNAHTWPDGSALGNRLLAALERGDRIVVHGAGAELCYRVTERVEVLADDGLPRYYATDGPPQLAIVVCSGRRLGPGVWEKRTVWFASPAA
jgi:hypothetical protein